MWCHPDSVIEIFGCKREESVPQRGTLFSDITVFLLRSVQDLYICFLLSMDQDPHSSLKLLPSSSADPGSLACTGNSWGGAGSAEVPPRTIECHPVISDNWRHVGKGAELLSSTAPCMQPMILGFVGN